jgi:predicted phosphodiesterase
MSKIIVIGDVHADAPKQYDIDANTNIVLDSCCKALNYIFDYGESISAELYIFLGDIFEKKDRLPNRVKNPIIDIFKKNKDKKIMIIEGNHDTENNESNILFLEPYAEIIRKPEFFFNLVNGPIIRFVPFNRDNELIRKAVIKGDYDILLGHFEVKGCHYGGIKESVNGVSPKLLKPLAILGHIHESQQIKEGIYYVGSIYQQDWNDASMKYFYVYCYKDELASGFEEIPLFINRRYFGNNTYIDEDINMYSKYGINTDCYYLAKVFHEGMDYKSLDKIRKRLVGLGYAQVVFELIPKLEPCKHFGEQQYDISKPEDRFKMFAKGALNKIENLGKKHFYKKILEDIIGKR